MATINLDFVHDIHAFSSPSTLDVLQGQQSAGPAPEFAHISNANAFDVPTAVANGVLPSLHGHPTEAGLKYAHGTTTLGFVFASGVLIAVDSRASMGSYIGSGTVRKVIPISRYLLGTMAGGAADCSFWERNLAMQCRIHELREGKRISVAAASKLLANNLYSYKGMGLSLGTMIAGWDETKGPQLYYVDDDGTRLKGDRFSAGSGSTYAYGVLDIGYKELGFDMSIDNAVELGKRAIYHATHRDAMSGGTINVFVITADGVQQKFSEDMNELHYGQYAQEREKAAIKPPQTASASAQ